MSLRHLYIFFLITRPQAHHLQSKKFYFLLKFCVKIHNCLTQAACDCYLFNFNIYIQILLESDEWFSPFSLSDLLVERRAFERRAKRDFQKMNAWASAIQGKKLNGERIANLEKMSECPASDNTEIFSHIWGSHEWLQLLPFEFPNIWGNFLFFFISAMLIKAYRTTISECYLFTIKYYLDCKPPVAKLNLTTQRKIGTYSKIKKLFWHKKIKIYCFLSYRTQLLQLYA